MIRMTRMLVFFACMLCTAVIAYNMGYDTASVLVRESQYTANRALNELEACIQTVEQTADLLSPKTDS